MTYRVGNVLFFSVRIQGDTQFQSHFFNFHELAVGRPLPGCFAAKPRDTNLDEAIDFPRFLRKPAGQAGRSVHGRVGGRSPFPERSRKASRAARAPGGTAVSGRRPRPGPALDSGRFLSAS